MSLIKGILELVAQIAGYLIPVIVAGALLIGGLVFAVHTLTTPARACDAWVSTCAGSAETRIDHNLTRGVKSIRDARVVGRRPRGCPRRHCGCSLSIKIFGRIIPKLNLAANWLAFPRTAPAPGMVAARHGHVMRLIRHVEGKHWLVWDPNSGRGLTRIHVRSLAGFVVVNPLASTVAGAARPGGSL